MMDEIPVTDEQEFDVDAEIAAVDRVALLLQLAINQEDITERAKPAVREAILLLNGYADELEYEKERNG